MGNYVILWQIEKTRSIRLPYLFPGCWIKSCSKCNTKASFDH
ncbi:MAG: arginyltransferase, partial [Pseudohongiellaceae bacterium]